jgi:hypothetical protein
MDKMAQWTEILAQYARSGTSALEFCRTQRMAVDDVSIESVV